MAIYIFSMIIVCCDQYKIENVELLMVSMGRIWKNRRKLVRNFLLKAKKVGAVEGKTLAWNWVDLR